MAATDSTVLLLGETGTGKELFATQIHELSARRGRAMVRVNCSAIPGDAHGKRAVRPRKRRLHGRARPSDRAVRAGRSSTIFLDEIGELPPDVQVKLLRVLEERQIERLGSPTAIRVDTRIIAATHRDLEQRIADGAFREDLFYRLNVFPDPGAAASGSRRGHSASRLAVRRGVLQGVRQAGRSHPARKHGRAAAVRLARQHPRAAQRRRTRHDRRDRPAPDIVARLRRQASRRRGAATKLTDVEREHIRSVLESAGWRIRGAGGAADRLGLKPTTLETRMAKLGITRPRQPQA